MSDPDSKTKVDSNSEVNLWLPHTGTLEPTRRLHVYACVKECTAPIANFYEAKF